MDTLLKVLKLSEMLQNMCSMRKKAGVYIFLINHLFSPSPDFFLNKKSRVYIYTTSFPTSPFFFILSPPIFPQSDIPPSPLGFVYF